MKQMRGTPQRLACRQLSLDTFGLNQTVPVLAATVFKHDGMQHAVAVKRVVAPQRRQHRVFSIADINPIKVAGQLAFDLTIQHVKLFKIGLPRTGAVRMVVCVGQLARYFVDQLGHAESLLPAG